MRGIGSTHIGGLLALTALQGLGTELIATPNRPRSMTEPDPETPPQREARRYRDLIVTEYDREAQTAADAKRARKAARRLSGRG